LYRKEAIAWQLPVQLVITPASCACVGVPFLYEQKMKLLDKVVNVFYPQKKIQTVWWFFYFVHKNPTLFVWVFLSDFFCFMLTLMLSLKVRGYTNKQGMTPNKEGIMVPTQVRMSKKTRVVVPSSP
jgi:hypothetical protein